MFNFVPVGNLYFPEYDLTCADCGAKMKLIAGEDHGRSLMYRCSNHPKCRAMHAAFRDGRPVGTPGDKRTRALRYALHELMDPLWQKGHLTRRELYDRLADRLGLSSEDCHVGKFDAQQCRDAKAFITEFWSEFL